MNKPSIVSIPRNYQNGRFTSYIESLSVIDSFTVLTLSCFNYNYHNRNAKKKIGYLLLLSLVGILFLQTSTYAQSCLTVNSPSVTCSAPCTTLTASFSLPPLAATTTYTVSSIPYTPQSYTAGTNAFPAVLDDVFSPLCPIGFTFCYFGNTYTQCCIGCNGQVCFIAANAGAASGYIIAAQIPNNTMGTLGCIMGPLHDMDPRVGGTIRYTTVGTAPCRMFIVSWNNVGMYNGITTCVGQSATQQIILYEATNQIDINIASKQECLGWNSGFAQIGIENVAGTVAFAAPGRNSPPAWGSVTNESWRFTPTGATTPWNFTWTDASGAVIGSTLSTSVCPTASTTYSFAATNPTCGTPAASAVASVNVVPLMETISGTHTVCAGGTIALTNPTVGGTWTSTNTNVATILPSSGVVSGVSAGTTIITYRLSSVCFATTTVTVNASPSAISGTLSVCSGSTTTLSNMVAGGTWSSNNVTVASVGSTTGIVTGGAVSTISTATVTYTLPGNCATTVIVTVNPLPSAISGTPVVCVGSTTNLSNTASGGIWTSVTTAVATINSSGVVSGVASGTSVVSYTLSSGCFTTVTITVNPLPGVISTPPLLCGDEHTTLTNPTFGGTWSSSNVTVATIVSNTGVLWAVTGGSTVITYTLPTGCSVTTSVTVKATPTAFVGIPTMCLGSSTTLSSSPGGGTWTSTNTFVATISYTGPPVVNAVAVGSTTIYYTLSSGCSKAVTATVLEPSTDIVGVASLCAGGVTTLLSNGVSGGTWSSSNPTRASIDPNTGVVTTGTAFVSGNVVFTYIRSGGCPAKTFTITVNPLPSVTAPSICAGVSVTLSNAISGGAWSTSNSSIATVNFSSGVLTGITSGVPYTVTYTTPAGCTNVSSIGVILRSATPISGITDLCSGGTTQLSNGTSGTWSSSNTLVATIGLTTGLVTSGTAGTAIITRWPLGGCLTATITVTVHPPATPISGIPNLCAGSTTILSNGVAGGTWTSSNTSIATIDPSTGVVSGSAAGTTVISYSPLGGCPAVTTMVTVYPTPNDIYGSTLICEGDIAILHNDVPGGTWSSDNVLIATIDASTGTYTSGTMTGTTIIHYTLGSSCPSASISVTVFPRPGPIIGVTTICRGATGQLSDATIGGIWSSSNSSIVAVDPSFGVLTAVSAGTAVVTYTLITGCYRTATITILPTPTVISGNTTVCVGYTTFLSNEVASGTWSSSNTGVATIDPITGVVYGNSAGTSIITYTMGNGCPDATILVTVNPIPDNIIGSMSLCAGYTTALSDATAGGFWTSTNTSVATVDLSTGVVSAVSAGVTTIIYTVSATGCEVSAVFTVYPLTPDITGVTSLCIGSTTALSDATAGGTWSSSNTLIAPIDPSGVVHGIDAGSTTISYTLGFGCPPATITVNVNPLPDVITGPSSLCVDATVNMSDATPGGTWSSGTTSIAVINPVTGVITGINDGNTIITYTIGTGCYITASVTVNPLPVVVTGTPFVCVGSMTTLSDVTAGGTWGSSNTNITVNSGTGIITGITEGSATITYTIGTGCYITTTVTVNPLPDIITGNTSVCVGSITTLSDRTPGGTWSTTNTNTTVNSISGVVTGVVDGTAIITYTLGTGCIAITTVTVNPPPPAIIGTTSVCFGLMTTLSDATPVGIWSSSNTGIATISSTGVVSAVATGTVIITFTSSETSCFVTTILTVNPLPEPIIGSLAICAGSTTALTDAIGGGTWSSSNTGVATINSVTGIVYGVSAGTTTITYQLTTGCIMTAIFTVNSLPTAISGITSLCAGTTTSLSNTTGSGIWSSSNTGVATIDGDGIVYGINSGTSVISYALTTTGCIATTTVAVISATPITGITSVCVGSTTQLSDATIDGVWSSDNTSVATITASGSVSGIVTGTATITYTVTGGTGCTTITTTTITVVPLPYSPITGIDSICLTGSTSLSNALAGGVWTSSNTTIATVSSSGNVFAVSVGSVTISYTVSDGMCTNTILDTVKVVNKPEAIITGLGTMCVFGTITLSSDVSGGVWTSTNPAVSVDPVLGVVTSLSGVGGDVIVVYEVSNVCGTRTVRDTILVIPFEPPITGVRAVCSDTTTALSNIVGGGVWSSSDNSIVVVDPSSGLVTGIATGTATITYIATGICGTFTTTAVVAVNMPPYITTKSMVACQSLTGKNGRTQILNDKSGCILVCDSTVIRYYGNGVAGSVFTWVVSGGVVIHNYGDSIDVFWSGVGITGNILLTDTVNHCSGQSSICFKIIQKPHAYFTASSVNVCLGNTVIFHNYSTADLTSPIVSWYWDFGDGTATDIENPTHSFTTANPNDTVRLIVANACGCSDTFSVVINISPVGGPVITCPSIVCENEIATYSVPNTGCTGSYVWTVDGGTIISGAGTETVNVAWNAVAPQGYGYVSIVDPCSACQDTTTAKIPVILATAAISGPSVICVGQEYEYSLPLWPATQYMWGVLGNPSAIEIYRDDYRVVVKFTAEGNYDLHGWYQNTIKLCGGNVFKKITVLPAIKITGPVNVCQNEASLYTIGGMTANWVMTGPTFVGFGYGTSTYGESFPAAGMYVLTATGGFCSDPLTITANPAPANIDSVTGLDTVCLGRIYTYEAYSDVPGTIFNWQAIGGTVTASGSTGANVVWTGGGAMQLVVTRVSLTPPYCESVPFTVDIHQEVIDPELTGDDIPCANSLRTYSTSYMRGDVYDWSVIPTTAGSVVSGDHTTSVNVLWNDVVGTTPLPAAVVLTVHKCDSIVSDTFDVNVQPSPHIALTASPNPACPGSTVTFTSVPGGISYTWNFGDGSPLVTTSSYTTNHSFPTNTSTGNANYIVKVTVVPDPAYACPISGTAVMSESILPGPVALASTSQHLVCFGASSTILGTVTNNVGVLTYQWFANGIPISGATNATYTTSVAGIFSFLVTAANGCSTHSNSLAITDNCDEGLPCNYPLIATTSVACNVITLTGTPGGGTFPHWTAEITPDSGPIAPGTGAVVSYNIPGIYRFDYKETFPTCDESVTKYVTIGVAPSFVYGLQCAPSGTDSVFLADNTAFLPGWTVSGFVWTEATIGTLGSGSPNLRIALPAPGSYSITETVTGTDADGAPFSCSVTRSVLLPAKPGGLSALFTFSVSPICSDIPIDFTPVTTAGVYGYYWDFGDGSSSALQNTQRTYTNPGPSDAILDTVTLTVMDSLGCMTDTTATVEIRRNLFKDVSSNNNIGLPYQAICSNDAPATVAFSNGTIFSVSSYLWSTGATTSTISVNTSGTYWLTVLGSFQCQATLPSATIEIIDVPTAHIGGNLNYCEGDNVELFGYAGTGVSYQWYRDGVPDGTTSAIVDGGLSAGDYVYQLVLTVLDPVTGTPLCMDTATTTVHMYPKPALPVITGPTVVDCDASHLELTATEPVPGYYNWSDGTTGAVDNIHTGGAYQVWFTDLNGCISRASKYVPVSPDVSMQYFPVGCYNICEQQLPITLYGPPTRGFDFWEWIQNGVPVSSGSGIMDPYSLNAGGTYNWYLDNGLCDRESGVMEVTLEDCNNCAQAKMTATIVCTAGDPASYSISIVLYSPAAGTTYNVGTDMGPVIPFSGTLPGIGTYTLVLTYTTMTLPPPGTVNVEVSYVYPNGDKCFQHAKTKVPKCTWVTERSSGSDTANSPIVSGMQIVSNALLVFPNPASGQITISYDYGADGNKERSLSIYDGMGRKVKSMIPADIRGNWELATTDWMPGIYIVRMDGDGKTLQTQRFVITH